VYIFLIIPIYGTVQRVLRTTVSSSIWNHGGTGLHLARSAQTRGYYALTKLTPRTGSLSVKL